VDCYGERGPITVSGGRAVSGSPGDRVPDEGSGAEPPEADGILVLITHFCAVLELAEVANLTEATRQSRTFDTAAILSLKD